MFVCAAKETRAPVMYLDGPDAALTTLLMSRGVSTDRLVPPTTAQASPNRLNAPAQESDAESTTSAASQRTRTGEFGVVWFDMCGVDFGTLKVSDLVRCAVTSSTPSRQLLASDQQVALQQPRREPREDCRTDAVHRRSGKAMNMVFVVSKACTTRCDAPAKRRGATTRSSRGETRHDRRDPAVLLARSVVSRSTASRCSETICATVRSLGAVHSRVANSIRNIDSRFSAPTARPCSVRTSTIAPSSPLTPCESWNMTITPFEEALRPLPRHDTSVATRFTGDGHSISNGGDEALIEGL